MWSSIVHKFNKYKNECPFFNYSQLKGAIIHKFRKLNHMKGIFDNSMVFVCKARVLLKSSIIFQEKSVTVVITLSLYYFCYAIL